MQNFYHITHTITKKKDGTLLMTPRLEKNDYTYDYGIDEENDYTDYGIGDVYKRLFQNVPTVSFPKSNSTSLHYTNKYNRFLSPVTQDELDYIKFRNRSILSKDLFESVDFTKLGIIPEKKDAKPTFIEGENYSLKGVSCDGFEMEEKVYKLIKVVDDFYGTPLNSVIVKQISGEQGTIFTLSKNDCAHHGIEYETGLQLFPKSLNWTMVKRKVEFDKNNLSTTPTLFDNTIRFVLFKINGFKDYSDGYILTPTNHLVKEKDFINNLIVTNKEPIVSGNGYTIHERTNLKFKIVYPKNLIFNHANFISSEDTIFVLVKLEDDCGKIKGIKPEYLDGASPNDLFEISWSEISSHTLEEYEELKAEESRIEEENARKAIEAAKRKKQEEKNRIHNLKRIANIRFPKEPRYPMIAIDNISSADMFANELNNYINILESRIKYFATNVEHYI